VFHPAQWVWSLLRVAIESTHVKLFTRTKAIRVEDVGQEYVIHTTRGPIRARSVVNATESYTAMLHPQLRGVVAPVQTQMAYAKGYPASMKAHVSVSSDRGFYHRFDEGVCFGSDATRVPDDQAGRSQPSRFITKYVLGELKAGFGPFQCHLTHEWSGTSGFTPDEFPIVGLIDGKQQYIIAGMCGSGTGVSFHAGRWVCDRILELGGEDYYPGEYFSPTRLLCPREHRWPSVEGVVP
jgi:glycine/D-amino acid oxidase-like deaminating enzyme